MKTIMQLRITECNEQMSNAELLQRDLLRLEADRHTDRATRQKDECMRGKEREWMD